MTSTFAPKKAEIARRWHYFDAKGQVLGRLSTQIAKLLMGKGKVDFARYLDMGDHVVVVNAKEITITGNKETQKLHRHHSGYPGGMKRRTLKEVRADHPERLIIHAVSGMLPKNRLHDPMLTHLHVYPEAAHPYEKQFKKSEEKADD